MTSTARTDCVVDARGEQVIIWHVETGPDLGLSRLTGAWVFGADEQDKIELLAADRRVLATPTGEEILDRLNLSILGHIDPDATVKNIKKARDELQVSYETHPKRKTLVAPDWPALPDTVDPQNPPSAMSDAPTQVALAIARWLAQVAIVWEQIEGERIVRKYIPGGRHRLPTPIAMRKTDR